MYTPAILGYECVCKEGFSRDSQHNCVISEDTCGGGVCVENAECLYDEEYETFYCNCKPGYVGDGIEECKLKPISCNVINNCGVHATCEYEPSEIDYVCKCIPGYFGDGFTCYKERNCQNDLKMCDSHASCVTDASRYNFCF